MQREFLEVYENYVLVGAERGEKASCDMCDLCAGAGATAAPSPPPPLCHTIHLRALNSNVLLIFLQKEVAAMAKDCEILENEAVKAKREVAELQATAAPLHARRAALADQLKALDNGCDAAKAEKTQLEALLTTARTEVAAQEVRGRGKWRGWRAPHWLPLCCHPTGL